MFDKLVLAMNAVPYGPQKLTSNDVATALPATVLANTATGSTRGVLRVTITCETNSIRYAFGVTPDQANAIGHLLTAGSSVTIGHPQAATLFKFISAAANTAGVLQVTGEYGE